MFSCYNKEYWPYTIVDDVFGECSSPCILKTSFTDFEKVVAHYIHYKRLNFSSLPNSLYFSSSSQSHCSGCPILPSLLFSFDMTAKTLLSYYVIDLSLSLWWSSLSICRHNGFSVINLFFYFKTDIYRLIGKLLYTLQLQ